MGFRILKAIFHPACGGQPLPSQAPQGPSRHAGRLPSLGENGSSALAAASIGRILARKPTNSGHCQVGYFNARPCLLPFLILALASKSKMW